MRRWSVRILLALLALAVLLIVIVQAVLWTDLPRRIVVDQLQQKTGLSVRLDAINVSWFGNATLHDLRVTPPLSSRHVLEAPRIEANHTSLPGLLFGRPLRIDALTLDEPTIHLREDEPGQWNLQRVVEAIRGAQPPPDPERVGPIALPALTVRDATLRIVAHDRPPYELTDVHLTGQTGAAVDYNVRLDASTAGTIEARLSRASPHPHELRFDLHPPATLFAALGLDDKPYRAAGQWHGQLEDGGGVNGELTLTALDLPDLAHVAGRALVQRRPDNGALVLRPRQLRVEPAHGPAEHLTLDAGRLTWHESTLTARALHLLAFGGDAYLTGTFDPAARTGEAHATWQQLNLPDALTHHGELDLTLTEAGPARRRAELNVRTTVDSPLGQWRGRLGVTATGRRWQQLDATATLRQLRLTRGERTFAFPDLAGHFAVAAPTVRLDELRLLDAPPQRRLAGEGTFDWQTRTWSALLDAEQLPLPILPQPFAELSGLRLDAAGDGANVQLHEARFSGGDVVATAEGRYHPRADAPLRLEVRLEEAPIQLGDYGGELDRPWIDAENLAGGVQVQGTLNPVALNINGALITEALRVYHESVGDLTLRVHATADAQQLRASAEAVEWLDGLWQVHTTYPYGGDPRLTVEGENIDLALVDRLLGRRVDLEGRADLRLVTAPARRNARTPITGSFELRDVARQQVRADRVTGQLHLAANVLRIHQIEAQRADGRLTGELSLDLREPTRLRFDQTIEQWPALPGEFPYQLRLSGAIRGAFDPVALSGDAEAQLRAAATFENDQATRELATIETDWRLRDTTLTLATLEGDVLDGTLAGEGRVDLHALRRAELDMQWADVEPQRLAPVAEPLREAGGTLAGSIHLAPADERRAIGPLRVDLRVDRTDATYRGLPIGAGHATAYLDPDKARYVLHEMRFETVGGVTELWGRVGWQAHDAQDADSRAGGWYAFAQGEFEDLDLEQLTRTLRPEEEPILGRINGGATVTTPLHNWSRAFGRGELALRESDLANIPLISVLYDLVNVNWFNREVAGKGEAQFRVENGVVVFDRFHYTNRGTQIELALRIADIWQGAESPIEGYALVSVTPLPDIELLEMVNRAVAELQAGATTALLGGTLRNPEARPMLFHALQDEVRRLLVGAEYEEPAVNRPADPETETETEAETAPE